MAFTGIVGAASALSVATLTKGTVITLGGEEKKDGKKKCNKDKACCKKDAHAKACAAEKAEGKACSHGKEETKSCSHGKADGKACCKGKTASAAPTAPETK